MIVEQHTAMRFAWQREQSDNHESGNQGFSFLLNLITVAYNLIWWIPIVLPFFGVIDYHTGFVAFLAITIFRAFANLVRNNVLPPEQAERFPLRAP
jgi:hypothetical protein